MGQSQPPSRIKGLELDDTQENAWLEVIHKMEAVYSDLLDREVDLESKNAELEEANEFIDSILEAMSDVVIVCDRVGRIVKVNRPLLELTCFEPDELFGRPIGLLLGLDFEKRFGELIPENDQKSGLSDYETVILHKDGKAVDPVSLNASVRRNAKGFVDGLVFVGRPIGELRQAYDQLNKTHEELKTTQSHLLQSEKMASIGRLVAGVAHELNNPISFLYANVHSMESYANKMRRYIESLREMLAPDIREELDSSLKIKRVLDDLPDLLDGTREGAERVSAIVNNLRRLSFHDDRDKSRVDLTEIIDTAVRFARKSTKLSDRVELDLPQTLWVNGSANRLHQVFLNLVENAFDAIADSEDTRVHITAVLEDEHVVISIRDHGPGFGQENIDRIFDPFFTTKSVGEGTGLGLWISYEIVHDHNGELTAHNHKDGGAEFRIVLPFYAYNDPMS